MNDQASDANEHRGSPSERDLIVRMTHAIRKHATRSIEKSQANIARTEDRVARSQRLLARGTITLLRLVPPIPSAERRSGRSPDLPTTAPLRSGKT